MDKMDKRGTKPFRRRFSLHKLCLLLVLVPALAIICQYQIADAGYSKEKMDYSGQYLREIPSEVFKNENLTELWFGDNSLSTLSPEIGKLTNLKVLSLGHTIKTNLLTTLPPEIGNLANLTELWLNNNQLTSLPPEIGNLTNLAVFWIV